MTTLADRLAQARRIHSDRYQYPDLISENEGSLTFDTKMRIECSIHGSFYQTLRNHLIGKQNCPQCGKEARKISIKRAHEELKSGKRAKASRSIKASPERLEQLRQAFIDRANSKYGYNYSYDKVDYKGIHVPVVITCPLHGDFEKTPNTHLVKSGCPQCSLNKKRKSQEEFIKQACEVHKGSYSYDKVTYTATHKKATITCPVHGDFEQAPADHLSGRGCSKCGIEKVARTHIKEQKDFITEAQALHPNLIYSSSVYRGNKELVEIECPMHGIFLQLAGNHLAGSACPTCSHSRAGLEKRKSVEQFIEEGRARHGNKYTYDEVVMGGIKIPVRICCPKHGMFEQTPDVHLNAGSGCPNCGTVISRGHQQIIDYLLTLGLVEGADFTVNDRSIIRNPTTRKPLELDIYFPRKHFAIEFQGLYIHSYDHLESTAERQSHFQKQNLCNQRGISLLQVYDTEWALKPDLIKSMIKNRLGLVVDNLGARKGRVVTNLPREDYQDFLTKNHIQGAVESSLRYGLLYKDTLVSVLGFAKKKEDYHLERFCSKTNMIVSGAFSKLFKAAREDIKQDIITFSDRRYATGNLYKVTGFEEIKLLQPDIAYVFKNKLINRQHLQKQKLPKLLGDSFNSQLTEAENLFNNGYRRLWGSGKIKWIYRYQAVESPQQVDLNQLSDNITA